MKWTSRQKRQWNDDLAFVTALCFPVWRARSKVSLIFSSRRVPRVFALCDPQSLTIGLFPLARSLSQLRRQETLVHEYCHLQTSGLHTRHWKRAMKVAAVHARSAGFRRLARMIEYDVTLYQQRPVTPDEVERQLVFVLRHLSDTSYGAVKRHLADWAGWPVRAFVSEFPWLHEAWHHHSKMH